MVLGGIPNRKCIPIMKANLCSDNRRDANQTIYYMGLMYNIDPFLQESNIHGFVASIWEVSIIWEF